MSSTKSISWSSKRERNPEAANQYHSYRRGWRDGAACTAMDPKFAEHPTNPGMVTAYNDGYTDGRADYNRRMESAQKRYQHTVSILRTCA